MRIYDLSVVFSEELPVYGNDPGVNISEHYAISRGQACNLSRVDFGSHTGTHIDVPKHFLDNGDTCDSIPLQQFFGMAKVFDLRAVMNGRLAIERADLECLEIAQGDIVLFNTGNSTLMYDKNFHTGYVSLSPEAAAYLADKKIKTVGIDYLSVEAHGGKGHPTHSLLLGNGITIIEGLVFDNDPLGFVPQGEYFLSALPLKIKDGNGSPVRAVLADKRKLELAIFDMDGLMLDTEPVSVAGWRKAGERMGYEFTPELFDSLFGSNRKRSRERMEAYFGEGFDYAEALAIRTAHVRSHIEEHGVVVKKGLPELLRFLDEQGIQKCVATSTDRERAEQLLDIAGLSGRFDGIIGGDAVVHSKPNPTIFLNAAGLFHTAPENALVFEDSANGAEAAYAAGMRCILVPDLSAPNKKTRGIVSAVCKDLLEGLEIVKIWA